MRVVIRYDTRLGLALFQRVGTTTFTQVRMDLSAAQAIGEVIGAQVLVDAPSLGSAGAEGGSDG